MNSRCVKSTLKTIDCNSRFPFSSNYGGHFLFFRPILEGSARMTEEEIIEWLARGNGLICSDYKEDVENDELWWNTITTGSFASELKKEISEIIRIRHFGTDEILIPTRDIFLRDCRGGKE